MIPAGGQGQSADRLDTLPQPLAVRVVDDGGARLAGVAVTWTISDPDGRIILGDSVTDHEGHARVTVVLGSELGTQTIEARARGFDDTARFTATATSSPQLKAISLMQHAGYGHMCALDPEGRAWCWGSNGSGQLGNGTSGLEWTERPQQVSTTERFTRLWGTFDATCGLNANGQLFCWGRNAGLYGNGSADPSLVPVPAAGALRFSAVHLGSGGVACGVTLTGEGYCWGEGPLGDGLPERLSLDPVRLSVPGPWREIAADDYRGCAVSEDGEVYCWASMEPPQWIGVDAAQVLAPTRVPIVGLLRGLSMGYSYQCGVQAAVGPVCWGNAIYGPHSPEPSVSPGPVFPQAEEPLERIRVSGRTLTGRSPSGRLWIWGENPGFHDLWLSRTPVALRPAGPWLDFTTAHAVFGILASDSTVWEWNGDALWVELGGDLLPSAVPLPS